MGAGAFGGCVGGDDSTGQPDATTDASASDATTQDVVVQDVNNGDGATGCAARTANDAAGLFIAPTGSDTSSCGTRSNPCQSISYTIAAAKSTTGKTTLYLSKATYIESVTLDAALTLEGGWSDTGGTWSPVCDATTSTAVTIQGVTNVTISAAFAGAGTLRDLQVTSKAQAAAGESIYGVFATGSSTNLTLDGVVIDVGGGGTGTNGVAGTDGVVGSDAGCAAGNGAAGSTGSAGGGAPAGSLSATGYSATNGADAGVGNTGANGTAGGADQCMANCGTCKNQNPSCVFGTATECSSPGVSGCGGTPGTGGSCGTGGGSSVALFVWDAHLTIFGGSLTSGSGGNGGVGGLGGDGGAGSSGAIGAEGFCPANNFSCSGGFCVLGVGGTTLTGGSAGGTGGVGGVGGQGGGGSGGDSYAIVTGGDGGTTLNGSPTLVHGDGGTGGAANGANGAAADRFP